MRREIFVQITPEQRACFRVVEAYQDCNRRFGVAWSQHKDSQNEPIKHASAKQLESLVQQRDRLAFQIVKDRDLYSEALNFYQIGQATSLFGEKISQEYERKACARWFKLQDHAAGYERHEHKNTVQVVKEKITYTDLKSDSALMLSGAEKTTTHLDKLSLKELLSQYVAMEVEQTRLVSHLHSTRLKDTNAAKEISREAIAHSNLIKVFVAEATQLPQVKQEIEALKAIRPANVTQRGGFIAICDRINKNEWAKEDIHALLVQLRGKSFEQSRDRSEDRSRGGRSQ